MAEDGSGGGGWDLQALVVGEEEAERVVVVVVVVDAVGRWAQRGSRKVGGRSGEGGRRVGGCASARWRVRLSILMYGGLWGEVAGFERELERK